MSDQAQKPNLSEIRAKIEKSGLPIDPVMIVHYGRITLHVVPETYNFSGDRFHLTLAVTKEFKPERQKRTPKPEAPQAAKAKK